MSQAHIAVLAALKSVHSNAWAIELPPSPTWPAIVFSISSEREQGWCLDGAPDLHEVRVLVFSVTLAEATTLRDAAMAALQALPSAYGEPQTYDGKYEDHPDIFGQGLEINLRIRSTP